MTMLGKLPRPLGFALASALCVACQSSRADTAPDAGSDDTPRTSAALAAGAAAGAPVGASGYVLHRDPKTDRFTPASSDEILSLKPEEPSTAALREERRGVARFVRLRGHFRGRMVAHANDGALTLTTCDHGEEAAHDAR